MIERIEFVRRERIDWASHKKGDEVIVLRDGREVAVLPEADRLERAMALPLEEAKWIAAHFKEIMRREPTEDEREFWKAVADYKVQLTALLDEDASLDKIVD